MFMCAFGKDTCSTAVATWLLVVMALFAFVAAIIAANWAHLAYQNETEPRLGEDACTLSEPHRVDRTFYLSLDGDLLSRLPFDDTTEKDYQERHHSFTNLGRSALGNVCVRVVFRDEYGSATDEQKMPLGNFGVADSHRERHVAIKIPTALLDQGEVYVDFTSAYAGDEKINAFLRTEVAAPVTTTTIQLPLDNFGIS